MNRLRSITRRVPLGPVIALAVLWVAFSVLSPRFATVDTVFSVLQGFAFIALIAAGVGAVMICGELDLSVGSAAAVSGILAVQFSSALGVWPAILLATVVMGLFGVFQGLCIALLKINSLVFTIGALFALRGVATILTDGSAILLPSEFFETSDDIIRRLGILSPYSLITIGVLIVIGAFLATTRWGREIYAVGGARKESVAAGVPQRRPIVIAFAISGLTAGLAGALASIVSSSGSSQAFGDVLLLAVTAALVGGIGLYGGQGSMINVALGCLVLQTLVAGLNHLGATRSVQDFATGVLLFIVILLAIDWKKLPVALRRRPRGPDRADVRPGAAPAAPPLTQIHG